MSLRFDIVTAFIRPPSSDEYVSTRITEDDLRKLKERVGSTCPAELLKLIHDGQLESLWKRMDSETRYLYMQQRLASFSRSGEDALKLPDS